MAEDLDPTVCEVCESPLLLTARKGTYYCPKCRRYTEP